MICIGTNPVKILWRIRSKLDAQFFVQVTIPAYEKLPTSVSAASLGLDTATYQNVVNSQPKAAFIPNSDPECVARCQAAGANTLAPASALMAPVTNAGK